MFDSHYEFKQVYRTTKQEGELEYVLTKFAFRSDSGHRYLVDVEEYPHFVFAIKYYLKAHAESDNRFNEITGLENHRSHRIIGTCFAIMVEIYNKNPYASFAFVGSPMDGESRQETKRFNIYRKAVLRVFSEVHFYHTVYRPESCYIMINRDNGEENLLTKIEEMFIQQFDLNK